MGGAHGFDLRTMDYIFGLRDLIVFGLDYGKLAFIVLTNLMNAISCQTRCWAYNVEELDMIPAVSELVLLRCIFFLIFFFIFKDFIYLF